MSAIHVTSRHCAALWLSLLLLGGVVGGSAAESFDEGGNRPVSVPLGWAQTDIKPVINHASRVHRCHSRGFGARGYEQFYYRGDAEALNDVLRQFAATELPVRELVLRPGVAKTWSMTGTWVPYDWDLHLLTVMTLAAPADPGWVDVERAQVPPHLGEIVVGRRNPSLTVFLGAGSFRPSDIDIPGGITVVGPADLRERYMQAWESDDDLVRGEAAYRLAQLEPYNEANLPLFTQMLEEEGHGPYFAALALKTMGALAKSALPLLIAKLRDQDEVTENRFRDAIAAIEIAKPDQDAADAYAAGLAQINDLLKRLRGGGEG